MKWVPCSLLKALSVNLRKHTNEMTIFSKLSSGHTKCNMKLLQTVCCCYIYWMSFPIWKMKSNFINFVTNVEASQFFRNFAQILDKSKLFGVHFRSRITGLKSFVYEL